LPRSDTGSQFDMKTLKNSFLDALLAALGFAALAGLISLVVGLISTDRVGSTTLGIACGMALVEFVVFALIGCISNLIAAKNAAPGAIFALFFLNYVWGAKATGLFENAPKGWAWVLVHPIDTALMSGLISFLWTIHGIISAVVVVAILCVVRFRLARNPE